MNTQKSDVFPHDLKGNEENISTYHNIKSNELLRNKVFLEGKRHVHYKTIQFC